MSIPSNSVATTVNPVSPDNFNTYVQMCDTVADLRGFIGVQNQTIELLGTVSPGDGGQGIFYWNSTGTAPDDNGATTVIPSGSSAGNGEWTRVPSVLTGVQNLTNAINFASGGNVASASTTPIGAANGNNVTVTGTTTINAFDAVQAGTQREVTFAGVLTLVYNATSLILPTQANIITAAGDTSGWLSLGGGDWICIWYQRANGQALAVTASIKSIHQQIFTSGTNTYTPSAGMAYCIVEVIGGGGGGGGAGTGSTFYTAGSGGGGGGYSRSLYTATTVGSSQTVTVGAGGTAGSASGGNGGTGGTSSFGSLMSASGGVGGNGANSSALGYAGNTGGVGASGAVNTQGDSGGFSIATSTYCLSGSGGGTAFGGGGQGLQAYATQAATGGNGGGYGGGGGGGISFNNASGAAGGIGAAGGVIITEYCNI